MIGDDKLFAPLPREQQSTSKIASRSKGFLKHMGQFKESGQPALKLYIAKKKAAKREATNAAR